VAGEHADLEQRALGPPNTNPMPITSMTGSSSVNTSVPRSRRNSQVARVPAPTAAA